MAVDIGKIFEKELEKVFRSLEESHVLAWHRFPDTGAAGGNILAEQPSDYLLGLPLGSVSPFGQRMMLAEAKASEKKASLSKAAMRPSQRRAICVYRMLLQLPYLVFFWDRIGDLLREFGFAVRHQNSHQTIQFKSAVKQQRKKAQQQGYRHKCEVCGRTDTDFPDLQFRYCSKCAGYHCFCEDHIFNHTHFTQ